MDHIKDFSKVNPKISPGNTLPGANFQISPIENGSRLLGVVETSFWCLLTRPDLLSKSQTRTEDVRYPLHPLKGHLVHFRRFFKTFLLGVQDSNLAESGVFLLIICDSSRISTRGYFQTLYVGILCCCWYRAKITLYISVLHNTAQHNTIEVYLLIKSSTYTGSVALSSPARELGEQRLSIAVRAQCRRRSALPPAGERCERRSPEQHMREVDGAVLATQTFKLQRT